MPPTLTTRSLSLVAILSVAAVVQPAFGQFATDPAGGVLGVAQPFENRMPGVALHMVMQRPGFFGMGVPIRIFAYSDSVMNSLAAPNSTSVNGWPVADGREIPISQNQALFSQIANAYGGNGQTTMRIPDTRGRILVGPTAQRPMGTVVGSSTTTLTIAQLPSHNHACVASPTGVTGFTGGGQPFSTLQPSLTVDPVIQRFGIFPSNGGPDEGGAVNPLDGFYAQIHFNAGAMTEAFRNQRIPCDGAILQISQNSGLFALTGYNYGTTNPNTFGVPDLRFTAAVGPGGGSGLPDRQPGERFGAELSTLTVANLPPHSHSITPLPPEDLPFPNTEITGSGAPFNSDQPAQVIRWYIAINGVYPGSGISEEVGYIGELLSMAVMSGGFTPAGYLPCDGRLLSIAQYDTLFSLLGTSFGGDGVGTFAIPDLRGRMPVGASLGWNGSPALPAGTRIGTNPSGPLLPSLTIGNIPSHTHTFPCPGDYGRQGGVPGQDGITDNNDFIVFIDFFFAHNPVADIGRSGGIPGSDGAFNNNDFVTYIDRFFAGCS